MTFAVIYEREKKLYIELVCDCTDMMRQEFDDILPAQRMNKEIWSAIAIGGDVREAELFFLIHYSYKLVIPKLRAHDKTVVTRGHPWPINFYFSLYCITHGAYPSMPEAPEEAIEFVLNMFSQREKEIILARYKDYRTFAEIGAVHNMSSSNAQRIHEQMMRGLRRASKFKYLVSNPPDIRIREWRVITLTPNFFQA
jgi:hypothetical protein